MKSKKRWGWDISTPYVYQLHLKDWRGMRCSTSHYIRNFLAFSTFRLHRMEVFLNPQQFHKFDSGFSQHLKITRSHIHLTSTHLISSHTNSFNHKVSLLAGEIPLVGNLSKSPFPLLSKCVPTQNLQYHLASFRTILPSPNNPDHGPLCTTSHPPSRIHLTQKA